jgi:chemotaxis receptor (MCP) glutamine deamidase CheD
MNHAFYLFIFGLCLAGTPLLAQETTPAEGRQIELTPDELNSIIRKLTVVRQ